MKNHPSIHHQKGAALIVSLIILIAMTMLGITSMKSTMNEVSMAGNLRESGITFQAAEAGLKNLENQLNNGDTPASLISVNSTDPDYYSNTVWKNDATVLDVSLKGITDDHRPLYFLKSLGTWNPDSNVSDVDPGFSGYGQTSTAVKIDYFRNTVRGYGVTGNTFRTLQSFYGRKTTS